MVKIWDCRRKEFLTLEKKGGDIEIRIETDDGKVLYKGWFQLKEPWMRSYHKIVEYFEEIQKRMERQDE